MDQARLKYRIVGGIVLVALAAILVPVLNDMRQPLSHGPQAIDIPAEPTDGVASRLPVDAPPVEGNLPEPQDIPVPAAPPPPATPHSAASMRHGLWALTSPTTSCCATHAGMHAYTATDSRGRSADHRLEHVLLWGVG